MIMRISRYFIAFCSGIFEAIKAYFWKGYEYKTILRFMEIYDDTELSLRTLKRRLRDPDLARRIQLSPLLAVWNAVVTELHGPGNGLSIFAL